MACADAVIFVSRESERECAPSRAPCGREKYVVVVSPLLKERSPALAPGPLVFKVPEKVLPLM